MPITTKVVSFEPGSWRDVLNTTSCVKVCQWLVTGRWFSPGTLISSTNKTDYHDITEILLKVALNQTFIDIEIKFCTSDYTCRLKISNEFSQLL